jgi:hypothetical protein
MGFGEAFLQPDGCWYYTFEHSIALHVKCRKERVASSALDIHFPLFNHIFVFRIIFKITGYDFLVQYYVNVTCISDHKRGSGLDD